MPRASGLTPSCICAGSDRRRGHWPGDAAVLRSRFWHPRSCPPPPEMRRKGLPRRRATPPLHVTAPQTSCELVSWRGGRSVHCCGALLHLLRRGCPSPVPFTSPATGWKWTSSACFWPTERTSLRATRFAARLTASRPPTHRTALRLWRRHHTAARSLRTARSPPPRRRTSALRCGTPSRPPAT